MTKTRLENSQKTSISHAPPPQSPWMSDSWLESHPFLGSEQNRASGVRGALEVLSHAYQISLMIRVHPLAISEQECHLMHIFRKRCEC